MIKTREQVQVAAWTSMSMPLKSLVKIINQALADVPEEHRDKAEVTRADGVIRIVYWRDKEE